MLSAMLPVTRSCVPSSNAPARPATLRSGTRRSSWTCSRTRGVRGRPGKQTWRQGDKETGDRGRRFLGKLSSCFVSLSPCLPVSLSSCLGQADDPGQRRRRHGLPRDDQSVRGYRRRHGCGLPCRGRAARHGVHAVPSDRALRGRFEPLSHQRGGPRRRGVPARQERRPVHAGRGSARRTGPTRRRGPGHRPLHGTHATSQRLSRPVPSRSEPGCGSVSQASPRSVPVSAWTSPAT